MSTKEKLFTMLDMMTDEQLEGLCDFIGNFIKIGDEPNAETIEALRESEEIAYGKISAKRYSSAQEMIDDILGEEDEGALNGENAYFSRQLYRS